MKRFLYLLAYYDKIKDEIVFNEPILIVATSKELAYRHAWKLTSNKQIPTHIVANDTIIELE